MDNGLRLVKARTSTIGTCCDWLGRAQLFVLPVLLFSPNPLLLLFWRPRNDSTELQLSVRRLPIGPVELVLSVRRLPSGPTELVLSVRRRPSGPTELVLSVRLRPSGPTAFRGNLGLWWLEKGRWLLFGRPPGKQERFTDRGDYS